MATWMTHLRIAEKLIKHGLTLNTDDFLIGNIAPDCGVPIGNQQFEPKKEMTHFKDDFISYTFDDNINLERFFNDYVFPNQNHDDYSFYVGYYLHLLVDILWHRYQMNKRNHPIYQKKLTDDPSLYRKELFQLDLQYINETKHNIYDVFVKINPVKVYCDFLPPNAIPNHVLKIKNYYLYPSMNPSHIEFTSSSELTRFIEDSTLYILKHLSEKQILI